MNDKTTKSEAGDGFEDQVIQEIVYSGTDGSKIPVQAALLQLLARPPFDVLFKGIEEREFHQWDQRLRCMGELVEPLLTVLTAFNSGAEARQMAKKLGALCLHYPDTKLARAIVGFAVELQEHLDFIEEDDEEEVSSPPNPYPHEGQAPDPE